MEKEQMHAFLVKLESIWRRYPNLRFGQLIASSANYAAIYYADENTLLKAIEAKYGKAEEIEEKTHYLPNTKGRIYINNPTTNQLKAINKEELEEYLSKGWIKGRK